MNEQIVLIIQDLYYVFKMCLLLKQLIQKKEARVPNLCAIANFISNLDETVKQMQYDLTKLSSLSNIHKIPFIRFRYYNKKPVRLKGFCSIVNTFFAFRISYVFMPINI